MNTLSRTESAHRVSFLFLTRESVGPEVSLSAWLTRLFFRPITCSFGTLEGPRRPSLHRADPCSPCLRWLAAEWWPGAESVSWFRSPLERSSFLTFVLCTDKEISQYQPVWRNYTASSYTCFDIPEWEASSSHFLNSPKDCLYWKPKQFILKMWRMEKIVPWSASLPKAQLQRDCSVICFFPLEKYDRSN